MDSVFKALADKNRRKILAVLHQKDMTVGEISKNLTISGATLSHHLDSLKRARLVISERKGQFVKYSLNLSVMEEVTMVLMNIFNKEGK